MFPRGARAGIREGLLLTAVPMRELEKVPLGSVPDSTGVFDRNMEDDEKVDTSLLSAGRDG